jgi:hypothetical protein
MKESFFRIWLNSNLYLREKRDILTGIYRYASGRITPMITINHI